MFAMGAAKPAEGPVSSVIWMRPVGGARGPQPSRNRDAIALTAIGIADREGLAAVSMRRVATEIGTTASALYRYFARKDDLLNVMVDGVLDGALRKTGNWRADLRALGHSMRALFKRHSWLTIALAGAPTLGPNRLRALEATLDVLAPTGLALADRLVLIDTLTSYVRGFVASEIASSATIRESDLTEGQWMAEQTAYVEAIQRSGTYPLVSSLFEELRQGDSARVQDAGFAAGLEMVLDGITQRMASRKLKRARRRGAVRR
jgi:AcrR family transcriptional regulator